MRRKVSIIDKVRKAIVEYQFASMEDLGNILGISRQRVHQIITEHRLKYDRYRSVSLLTLSKQEIKAAIKSKMTQKKFCKKHKISLYLLRRHLKEYNLVWPQRYGMEKVKLSTLIDMLKRYPYTTLKDLGRVLGVTQSAISARIKAHNIKCKQKRKQNENN